MLSLFYIRYYMGRAYSLHVVHSYSLNFFIKILAIYDQDFIKNLPIRASNLSNKLCALGFYFLPLFKDKKLRSQ